MKIFLLISIVSVVTGAPFSSNGDGDIANYPPNDEESETNISFKYVELSNHVYVGWKIENDLLVIALRIPKIYTWMDIGFVENTNTKITMFDQSMFFRVRESHGLTVKSADWTSTEGFLASVEPVWEKESVSKSADVYDVIVSRTLGDLNYLTPLTMVYYFGQEKRFKLINAVFKSSFQTKQIDLQHPGSFLDDKEKKMTESINTTIATVSAEEREKHLETTTPQPVVVTPSTTTAEQKPGFVVTLLPRETTKKPVIIERISTIKTKVVITEPSNTVTPTTPTPTCPANCNCTNHTAEKDSHWYDVIRAKENSTYFAIIGTAALLTAIIVLVVACCCASSSAQRPPRSRKHKVAFYKVDDFDSDAEEELDLMDDNKRAA